MQKVRMRGFFLLYILSCRLPLSNWSLHAFAEKKFFFPRLSQVLALKSVALFVFLPHRNVSQGHELQDNPRIPSWGSHFTWRRKFNSRVSQEVTVSNRWWSSAEFIAVRVHWNCVLHAIRVACHMCSAVYGRCPRHAREVAVVPLLKHPVSLYG